MSFFRRAPEVEEIAAKLIADVEQHENLALARIEYVWKDKASKHHGRLVLASARKVGGIGAWLANSSAGVPDDLANEPLFVIEVAADTWIRLTDEQRIALVDHELCHCVVEVDDDGHPHLGMRGHDLEEFRSIVERHGFWKSDVATFGSVVAEQLTLAIGEAATFIDGLGADGEPDEPGEDPDGEASE